MHSTTAHEPQFFGRKDFGLTLLSSPDVTADEKRPPEDADRSPEALVDDVLAFDRLFSDRLGMDALRPEAKLLLILTRHGSLRIKQAMSLSGLSYRGFYILLHRLIRQDLVVVEGDSADRRVRNIRLGKPIFAARPDPASGSGMVTDAVQQSA